MLPLAEDVKILHSYLTARADVCMKSLSHGSSMVADCSELCQIMLAQVVAFNCRRGGEAQRMLISVYCSDRMENVNVNVCQAWKWPSVTSSVLCIRKVNVAEKFLCY